ncbi:MAG: hypothetical protein IPN76_17800 [Saprospiraceae bacterium]|nr:hypothetical protein [Saprospiraceae bacterium]
MDALAFLLDTRRCSRSVHHSISNGVGLLLVLVAGLADGQFGLYRPGFGIEEWLRFLLHGHIVRLGEKWRLLLLLLLI